MCYLFYCRVQIVSRAAGQVGAIKADERAAASPHPWGETLVCALHLSPNDPPAPPRRLCGSQSRGQASGNLLAWWCSVVVGDLSGQAQAADGAESLFKHRLCLVPPSSSSVAALDLQGAPGFSLRPQQSPFSTWSGGPFLSAPRSQTSRACAVSLGPGSPAEACLFTRA